MTTDFDYSRTINGNDTFRVQQSVNPTVPQFEGGNLSDTARGLLAGGGGGISVQGGGANAKATTRDVGRNELTENRLAGLLNQNNPYINRARRAAMDQSASRGLANSSIAAGNAEGAAIDRAMPIASQDAQVYGRTAAENMAAQNAITQANLQANTSTTNARIGAAASRANALAGLQSSILNNENRLTEQERDAQIQAYTDARRHAYNIENRESGDNWRFGEDLGFRREGLYENQRQFDVNDDWRQFSYMGDDRFRNRDLDGRLQLGARGQDLQFAAQRGDSIAQAQATIGSNPNMDAAEQTQAMSNASSSINAAFSSANNLPPFQLPPLPSLNLGGGQYGPPGFDPYAGFDPYGLPTWFGGG